MSAALAEFDRTVRAYSPDLYRYAYWLTQDGLIAEDLVQECFARARAGWRGARDPGHTKRLLFRILHNENLRRLPPAAFALTPLDPLEPGGALHVASDPGEVLAMRTAIVELPLAYREPLLLQLVGGFDCDAIGVILNITTASAEQRVARARKQLQARFDTPAGAARQGERS